jgi:hypothetical protein
MKTSENISYLVSEYTCMLDQTTKRAATNISNDSNKIKELLVAEGNWTPQAADHLIRLSKDYGSFMLRNALALSLALEIDDGAFGF